MGRIQEAQTIKQFGLQAGDRVGVLLAHPDDESLLVGGLLHALKAGGVVVHAMTATNGEASTKGNPDFVREGARQIESVAALSKLGIDANHRHYFNLPDSELHLPHARERLVSLLNAVVEHKRLSHLFTLGTEGYDGHEDHIQTHQAAVEVQRLRHISGKVLAVWELQRDTPGEAFVPVEPTQKLALAAEHDQFGIWPLHTSLEALPQVLYALHGHLLDEPTYREVQMYGPLLQEETYRSVTPNTVTTDDSMHNSSVMVSMAI